MITSKCVDIVNPYIKTIPDECAPFALLPFGSQEFYKFIMENFIDFYTFDTLDEYSDGYAIRFKNFMDWESFEGFDSLFIPMDIFLEYEDKLKLLIELINKDYLVLCCYNMLYIDYFKNCKEDKEHKMMVSGYNIERKNFVCQDFDGNQYQTFYVSFDEMKMALTNYPWKRSLKSGLFALKINNNINISYIKLYNDLLNLETEGLISFNNGVDAYGIEALRLYKRGIARYITDREKTHRFYLLLNHIRENFKLMELRIEYIQMKYPNIVPISLITELNDINMQVNHLFFMIYLDFEKNNCDAENVAVYDKLCETIFGKIKKFAGLFKDVVKKVIDINYDEITG